MITNEDPKVKIEENLIQVIINAIEKKYNGNRNNGKYK